MIAKARKRSDQNEVGKTFDAYLKAMKMLKNKPKENPSQEVGADEASVATSCHEKPTKAEKGRLQRKEGRTVKSRMEQLG